MRAPFDLRIRSGKATIPLIPGISMSRTITSTVASSRNASASVARANDPTMSMSGTAATMR